MQSQKKISLSFKKQFQYCSSKSSKSLNKIQTQFEGQSQKQHSDAQLNSNQLQNQNQNKKLNQNERLNLQNQNTVTPTNQALLEMKDHSYSMSYQNQLRVLQNHIHNLRQEHKKELNTISKQHDMLAKSQSQALYKANYQIQQLRRSKSRLQIDLNKTKNENSQLKKQVDKLSKEQVLISAQLQMTQVNYENQKTEKFKIIGEIENFKKSQSIIRNQIQTNQIIRSLKDEMSQLRRQNAQKLNRIISLLQKDTNPKQLNKNQITEVNNALNQSIGNQIQSNPQLQINSMNEYRSHHTDMETQTDNSLFQIIGQMNSQGLKKFIQQNTNEAVQRDATYPRRQSYNIKNSNQFSNENSFGQVITSANSEVLKNYVVLNKKKSSRSDIKQEFINHNINNTMTKKPQKKQEKNNKQDK